MDKQRSGRIPQLMHEPSIFEEINDLPDDKQDA